MTAHAVFWSDLLSFCYSCFLLVFKHIVSLISDRNDLIEYTNTRLFLSALAMTSSLSMYSTSAVEYMTSSTMINQSTTLSQSMEDVPTVTAASLQGKITIDQYLSRTILFVFLRNCYTSKDSINVCFLL